MYTHIHDIDGIMSTFKKWKRLGFVFGWMDEYIE